jgi:hypothetical protein
VLLQEKRTAGTAHDDQELPLQVCVPSPHVFVQARVAPSGLQGEMRIAVLPSQAPRMVIMERKARRGNGSENHIGARLR